MSQKQNNISARRKSRDEAEEQINAAHINEAPIIKYGRPKTVCLIQTEVENIRLRVIENFSFEQVSNERHFTEIMAFVCNSIQDIPYRQMRELLKNLRREDWIINRDPLEKRALLALEKAIKNVKK
jgi:hypothetical protein